MRRGGASCPHRPPAAPLEHGSPCGLDVQDVRVNRDVLDIQDIPNSMYVSYIRCVLYNRDIPGIQDIQSIPNVQNILCDPCDRCF